MMSYLKTLLVILCLLMPALLYSLGERPVSKVQEVRVAETAREMVVSGDWAVPRYNGELRLQKPPLPYWLTAASYKVFGLNATAVRLPAVIFGLLSVVLLFAWMRREAGVETAANTVLVLAASYIGVRYFRSGEADAMLLFFITLASMLGYQLLQNKDVRSQAMFGLVLGLGFLSKGPAALAIPLLSLLVFCLLGREAKKFKACFSWIGLGLFLLVAFGWYAWILWQLPDAASYFVGKQLDETFVSGTHAKPFWWYLAHFFEFFLPWGFLLIPAGWRSYRLSRQAALPSFVRFAWAWLAVVFVLLTLTINKQMQYALLFAPPLAIIIGHYLVAADGGFARTNRILFRIFLVAALATVAYLVQKGSVGSALLLLTILASPFVLKRLLGANTPAYPVLLVAAVTAFAYLYSEAYVSQEPRKVAAQTLMVNAQLYQPLYQLKSDSRLDDGALSFYAGRVVAPVREEALPALLQRYPTIWLVSADEPQVLGATVEVEAEADELKLYKLQGAHD